MQNQTQDSYLSNDKGVHCIDTVLQRENQENEFKCSPPAQGQEGDPPACKTKFVFSNLTNIEANNLICKLIFLKYVSYRHALNTSDATISHVRAHPCPQTSFFHLMLSTRTERTCLPRKRISTMEAFNIF